MQLGTDRVIGEISGAVATLTFNNPARRNAISFEMWRAIALALPAFDADPAVRVIVMRGAGGKAFASGADISEFEERRQDFAAAQAYNENSAAAWRALSSVAKPIVAAIEGVCMGGGLAVAMKADFRVATEGSRFGVPAARLGIAYPVDSVRDLVNLVGPAQAKTILFTGYSFGADEAVAMGLVTEKVEDGALDGAVDALTATLIDNAPLSIRASKQTIDALASGHIDADYIAELAKACFDSRDYAEGRKAFMEKRQPRFVGR